MPELVAEFGVRAPIDEVWVFLTDMDCVGRCISGCTVREIDADTHVWELRAKAGFLTRTFRLTTRVTLRDEANRHGEFSGSGDGLRAGGSVDLIPVSLQETAVVFALAITASGLAGGIIESVITTRADEYKRRLITCVRGQLEKP